MITEAAKAAKEIKALLTKHYPNVSFSVKSSNFANGDSIKIRWNLGPVSEDIEKLVGEFQYGHFDGMTDIYEHSNSREDIPQAKFVHCNREYKTQAEIENGKIWDKPGYQDLWKAGQTLYHIIARDVCKLMGVEYQSINTTVPDDYQHMIRGYAYGGDFQALVYQLLVKTPLMTGYHGVCRIKDKESGQEIINAFEIY